MKPKKPTMSKLALRKWRKKMGYTQEQAARFMCISKRGYQDWEYGITPVQPYAVKMIKGQV